MKISLITPAHNDGDTLELHIHSFLEQDYTDKELIVVNDGSTDNTEAILKKYKKHITYISFKKNQGACNARNAGAKIATGDALCWLPADSFFRPKLFTRWAKLLETHPDCGFIYGGYSFVDNTIAKPTWLGGKEILPFYSQQFDVEALKLRNYIDGSFPMYTELFWKIAKEKRFPDGLWNPKVKSLQDWDFWLSVVLSGVKGYYDPIIHFETTLPHKGGLSDDSHTHWAERVNFIKQIHHLPINPYERK